MWQWWNYPLTKVPEGKRLVRINCDETSICFWQGDGGGIVLSRKGHYPHRGSPAIKVDRNRLCANMTYVTLLADCLAIQKRLPQVLIMSKATAPLAVFERIRNMLPSNVFALRLDKGWNNKTTFAEIIRLTQECLATCWDSIQVAWIMDSHRLHFHPHVLRTLASKDMWPLMVPAKTTWVLQPLDTGVFQHFKKGPSRTFPKSSFAGAAWGTRRGGHSEGVVRSY